MDEIRSRRSVASLADLQRDYLDDQPPDITPIGGVPNLKVLFKRMYGLSVEHNKAQSKSCSFKYNQFNMPRIKCM